MLRQESVYPRVAMEADEEPPSCFLVVTDAEGNVVRSVTGPTAIPQRGPRTGSVSNVNPSILASTVEWPIQVTRHSPMLARGWRSSGSHRVCALTRDAKPCLPCRARSIIQRNTLPNPCSGGPGHGLRKRPSGVRCEARVTGFTMADDNWSARQVPAEPLP